MTGVKARDIVARKHSESIQDYSLQKDAYLLLPYDMCCFRS
jgi:hypothetical protein